MAGAVSAGAYPAGVLDFLIEALDAWYAARGSSQRVDIPKHNVVLKALGRDRRACAPGGVRSRKNFGSGEKTNRPYKNWAQTIDILPLPGTKDLNRDPIVRSVLDCRPSRNCEHRSNRQSRAQKRPAMGVEEPPPRRHRLESAWHFVRRGPPGQSFRRTNRISRRSSRRKRQWPLGERDGARPQVSG